MLIRPTFKRKKVVVHHICPYCGVETEPEKMARLKSFLRKGVLYTICPICGRVHQWECDKEC